MGRACSGLNLRSLSGSSNVSALCPHHRECSLIAWISACRGANITLHSPLQRVNQLPTQFYSIDFHGLTLEKNPIYLFNLTGARQ